MENIKIQPQTLTTALTFILHGIKLNFGFFQ
jgi:hypothetical protein